VIQVKKRLFLWTLILSICFCNVSFVSATENKWQPKTREIQIDGTTYQIKYVQADLSDPKVHLGGILANDRIATVAKMDVMAEELLQADVASLAIINGGYYGAYEKLPLPYGVIQLEGEFLHLGNIGSVFAVDVFGNSRVERLYTKITGSINGSSAADHTWFAWAMNHRYQTAGEIILFTSAFGTSTGSHDGTSIVVRNGIVTEITAGQAAIYRDGFTLLIDDSEYAKRFHLGDSVEYRIETYQSQIIDGINTLGDPLDWSDIVFALGAGPTLLKNGEIACDPAAEGFTDQHLFSGKEQRSFLAMTKAGEVLFGTVANISIADLAQAVKALGAENAINLDGGDSSAFYIDGVYDTKPTRALSNAVYLTLEDIPADSWAEAEIDAAEENALVPLLLQRRYTEAITREEACQLAVCLYHRLGGESPDLSSQVKGSFFDQAVQLKLQRGLAWDPTDSTVICQRQAVIQLLANVMDHFLPVTREYAALISVDQSEVAVWARDAIERLVACDIVQGVDFVYLAPRAITTREMAVLFSNRIYEYCRRVG